jgi:hypothetical protein
MNSYIITDPELMSYCIEFFILGWFVGFVSFKMGQLWKARESVKSD